MLNSSIRLRHALVTALLTVLLLAGHVLGQPETAASDYCSSLKANLCDEIDYPVGPVPKKCGSKVCGFTIKTIKKSPCSAEQRTLLSQLLPMCACSAQMQDALARAPSLMQPGQVDAVDRFTGVDESIFKDIVEAMECLESAGFPSMDVNQLSLRSDLENDLQSVKPMAGVKKYTVVELEELEAEDFGAAMAKAEACRDGGAAVTDPSSITSVPSYCKEFVQWYDEHSADATRLLIPMVIEVQRQFFNYLKEVVYSLDDVKSELQHMVSAEPWTAFFQAATDEAVILECDDPTTCYEGLLADPWTELHEMSEKLDGTHPALDVAALASTIIQGHASKAQAGFCDGTRKTKDTAYRQLSIYRAFWASLNAANYPQSKLIEHPKILSDMLVYVSGLPDIQRIETPIGAVHDVITQLHDQVTNVVNDFQARYQGALQELADDNYNILAVLSNKPPKYCPKDHSTPLVCVVDKCNAAVSPIAPPNCPAGTRCTVDACNGCNVACTPMPVSSSDAGNAIAIMQTWMDLIRKNDGLAKSGDIVKGGLDNLMNSLDYLVSEGSSPGGRNFIYQSGLLTYNEVGKASGSFPCFQGVTRVCYSYKGFKKQCKLVPHVGACIVKKTWTMPNEHVPWVALHSGINDLFYAALDRMDSYFRGSDPAAGCS